MESKESGILALTLQPVPFLSSLLYIENVTFMEEVVLFLFKV